MKPVKNKRGENMYADAEVLLGIQSIWLWALDHWSDWMALVNQSG